MIRLIIYLYLISIVHSFTIQSYNYTSLDCSTGKGESVFSNITFTYVESAAVYCSFGKDVYGNYFWIKQECDTNDKVLIQYNGCNSGCTSCYGNVVMMQVYSKEPKACVYNVQLGRSYSMIKKHDAFNLGKIPPCLSSRNELITNGNSASTGTC